MEDRWRLSVMIELKKCDKSKAKAMERACHLVAQVELSI
jgi:hypothetical protein